MKYKHYVCIPIAGYISVEVETDSPSEKEAIKEALAVEWGDCTFEIGNEKIETGELEQFEKLVEGNVCYTYHTRAEVTKTIQIDEDDNEIERGLSNEFKK